MKMVYAQSWMIDALKAAHLPPTALLDLPVLLDTLSTPDVAFYLAMNRDLKAFIPEAIVDSFTPIHFDLALLSHAKTQKLADQLTKLQFGRKEVISPEARDETKRLTCDLLDPDTIVFRHIVTSSKDVPAEVNHISLAERLLRQMYTTLSFEKVVVLPVFNLWLSLRRKMLAPNKVV